MSTLLLVLVSALAYGFTFPPWSSTAAAWVALVPFLYVLRNRRPRSGFCIGLLWGIAANTAIGYWVPSAIAFYYLQSWWFELLFCLATSLVFWMPYYALFAACACWISRRSRGAARVLLIAVLWVACELGRARLMTGAPWLLLGYALVPHTTLMQAADLGGPYLLSFIVVLVNASLTEILFSVGEAWHVVTAESVDFLRGDAAAGAPHQRRGMNSPAEWLKSPLKGTRNSAFALGFSRLGSTEPGNSFPGDRGGRLASSLSTSSAKAGVHWRSSIVALLPAAIMLIGVYAYGVFRLGSPLPDNPAVPVTVVQGNNVIGAQWRPGSYGKGLDHYLRMSSDAAEHSRPSVIVWPEAAVPVFLAREPRYQEQIERMLGTTGADLILGAPHYEDPDPARPQYLNSAFYLTPTGMVGPRYDKAHLMPFAEYFPLRTIELLRRSFEAVRTFTPRDGTPLLDTKLGKAAVAICFEADFPELVREQMRRGAEVLVNLSNDVWLGPVGQAQHLAMVTLRAVENHTWVIRATTTGISAIIDPFGRVRARTDTFTEAVLDARVVPMQVETAYKRFGDLFACSCVVASAIGMTLVAMRSS